MEPEVKDKQFQHFLLDVDIAMQKGGLGYDQRMAARALMGEHNYMQRMIFIVVAWQSGKSLEEVGVMFGISRERIRQIIEKAKNIGILDPDNVGGYHVSASAREQEVRQMKKKRNEARIQSIFSCSVDEFNKLNEGRSTYASSKTRAAAFLHQRRAMLKWNNVWKLTFPEWCKLWDDSNKWRAHGRGRGKYTLGRIDSNGAFELGNVAIMKTEAISSGAGSKPTAPGEGFNLAERQEEVRRLHDDEGLPFGEVAKRMGLKTNTVSGYACAARRLLRIQGIPITLNVNRQGGKRKPRMPSAFPQGSLGAKLTG